MFVATAVIVLGYVVPHLVRAREVTVDSRVNDRFSEALRLVEVGIPEQRAGSSTAMIHTSGKKRTEALAMIRPTAPHAARVNARELAASRAACAAEISRRDAASRRRMVVMGVLALATAAVGILGATAVIHAAFVAIPAVLLASAGYLSVRAEKARRVADARTRSQMHRLDQRLRLFRSEESAPAEPLPARQTFDEVLAGGAHAPTVLPDSEPRHARTIVPEDEHITVPVDERTPHERAESRREVREATAWTPAPVPVPTYTLKQDAPRRAVPPVVTEAPEDGTLVPERPTHAVTARRDADSDSAFTAVDTVLARRRASGM